MTFIFSFFSVRVIPPLLVKPLELRVEQQERPREKVRIFGHKLCMCLILTSFKAFVILLAKLTVLVYIFFQIHGMRWLQRRQDLFCLPWLLLAAPSVALISGQLNEPALAQSLDQRLHACRLKTITRNFGNQGPSIPRGELYRSVSKSLAKCFPSRLFLVCSTAILQLYIYIYIKEWCLVIVLFL